MHFRYRWQALYSERLSPYICSISREKFMRLKMRSVLLLLLCAVYSISPAWTFALDRPVSIEDGGYPRYFEIARDELQVTTRTGERTLHLAQPLSDRTALQTRANTLSSDPTEEVELVLYEVGVDRNEFTRRILTRDVLVRLDDNTLAPTIAAALGLTDFRTPEGGSGYVIFTTDEPGGALDLAQRLRQQPGVLSADPILKRLRQKKSVPNDPLFSEQWHLRNTGQSGGTVGLDVRITNVWAQNMRGNGIRIGIVDDGLQHTHPDLAANYSAAYSHNWNGSPGTTHDPAPDLSLDDHGTACAGVAAARGDNSAGVAGAAYLAQLAGLRLISGNVSDVEEAEAMAFSNGHIFVKSNSWGPDDDGQTLEAPGPLTRAALSNSVVNGRNGRGTIFVWAGGNGLDAGDNANYDGYANSIYTLSISAVTDHGHQPWYSEPGACHIVTAPSSAGSADIVTTDLMGNYGYNYTGVSGELNDRNYTQTFGGTSSSTPLVAGIVALLLEANPTLGWRDVQEILIRSARQINPGDGDWRTNGAGFTFNHKFGSGLVDASAAVALAQTWTNLAAQATISSNRISLALAIPDNNMTGTSASFNIQENLRVEQVTLRLNISHTRRGDLEIFLTSPSGMESQLAEKRTDTGNHYSDWTFMSVRHWGESAQGVWTVRVADRSSGTSGTLNAALLTLYGTSTPALAHQPPVLASIGPRAGLIGQPFSFMVSATDLIDHDSITLSASNLPPWATFSTQTETGTVTQTFSGTPLITGVWTTLFHAVDQDGFAEESVVLTVQHPDSLPDLIIDFEGVGETKGAYAFGVVSLSGGSWSLDEALIGTETNDRRNGVRSARIRALGSLTMLNDKTNGIGTLTLHHARYGTDVSTTAQIEYSINGGANWTAVGSSFTSSSTNLALHTVTLNQPGPVRIRIIKTTGTDKMRMSIDDIAMTPFADVPHKLYPIGHHIIDAGEPLSFPVIAVASNAWDEITLSADPVPFWSTFPSVSAPGGVTNIFSATFPWPGHYEIEFRAEDSDGLATELVQITVTNDQPLPLTTSFPSGLPSGWSVVTPGDASAYWRFDDPHARGNWTGGSGFFAIADSDHAGLVPMDTELRSPAFSLEGLTAATLTFKMSFKIYSGDAIADVDISVNGSSGPWNNLWRRQLELAGPTSLTLDLASALGETNVMIRFHYYEAIYDWYWQVDDVVVEGITAAYVDMDGDGIPDQWEQQYFGNLTTADGESDTSGNGFLDLYEFLAGTDPTNATTLLRLEQQSFEPGQGVTISWQSATGKTYRVARSTNLVSFAPIAIHVPADPPLNEYTDPSPPESGLSFYRIELEVNP